jgi:hypothetical protein
MPLADSISKNRASGAASRLAGVAGRGEGRLGWCEDVFIGADFCPALKIQSGQRAIKRFEKGKGQDATAQGRRRR